MTLGRVLKLVAAAIFGAIAIWHFYDVVRGSFLGEISARFTRSGPSPIFRTNEPGYIGALIVRASIGLSFLVLAAPLLWEGWTGRRSDDALYKLFSKKRNKRSNTSFEEGRAKSGAPLN